MLEHELRMMILHKVLKFQIDRSRSYGEEAGIQISVENEIRGTEQTKRISAVTIGCLRLQCRHSNDNLHDYAEVYGCPF